MTLWTSIAFAASVLGLGAKVSTSAVDVPVERRALLPGGIDERIPSIDGLSCKHFNGYTEQQTIVNILKGDIACSGGFTDQASAIFRGVNFLETTAGPLPVLVFGSSERLNEPKKTVIFVPGGPRSLFLTSPLITQLVKDGFAVVIPIYFGELESRHPAPDLPIATQQVRNLIRWTGKRLAAVVGNSAGGYVGAAACEASCPPFILLAPLLTTPRETFSLKRIGSAKAHDQLCLWRPKVNYQVCDDRLRFFRSFWGRAHYDTSLATLLKGKCGPVRIVVSTDDSRIFDDQAVRDLSTAGCRMTVLNGYKHSDFDDNATLNARTSDMIRSLVAESRNRSVVRHHGQSQNSIPIGTVPANGQSWSRGLALAHNHQANREICDSDTCHSPQSGLRYNTCSTASVGRDRGYSGQPLTVSALGRCRERPGRRD